MAASAALSNGTASLAPAPPPSTARTSAGVAAQNSSGRHPATRAITPASAIAARPSPPSVMSPPLQYLPQQGAQRRADRRQPLRHDRLADRLARQHIGPILHAVPEQRRQFAQRQPPVGGAFDQREQRPQFALRRDQRGKARSQHQQLASNAQLGFAAQSVRRAHRLATAPLDSRLSV